MGAHPGSLARGKRTLPGQRGRIDIAPVLRQDRKVQCKSKALLRSRKVSGTGESFLQRGNGLDVPAGAGPRPASVLEGNWLCGKESSSPDPKYGEQW